MNLKINKEQIATVQVKEPEKSKQYAEWTEAGKETLLFGLITINEWPGGYYNEYFKNYHNKEEWEKDGYFEPEPKGGLYHKPQVILEMSSGRKVKKTFESSMDMGFWVHDNLKDLDLINIK